MNKINPTQKKDNWKLFTDWHGEHKEDLCKGVFWKTPQASRPRDWNWKQICKLYCYYLLNEHFQNMWQPKYKSNSFIPEIPTMSSQNNFKINLFQSSQDGSTCFVKIHAPVPVLERFSFVLQIIFSWIWFFDILIKPVFERFAEVLNIRKPIKVT